MKTRYYVFILYCLLSFSNLVASEKDKVKVNYKDPDRDLKGRIKPNLWLGASALLLNENESARTGLTALDLHGQLNLSTIAILQFNGFRYSGFKNNNGTASPWYDWESFAHINLSGGRKVGFGLVTGYSNGNRTITVEQELDLQYPGNKPTVLQVETNNVTQNLKYKDKQILTYQLPYYSLGLSLNGKADKGNTLFDISFRVNFTNAKKEKYSSITNSDYNINVPQELKLNPEFYVIRKVGVMFKLGVIGKRIAGFVEMGSRPYLYTKQIDFANKVNLRQKRDAGFTAKVGLGINLF